MNLRETLKKKADDAFSYEKIWNDLMGDLNTAASRGYYDIWINMNSCLGTLPLDVKKNLINKVVADLTENGLTVDQRAIFDLVIKWN